MFFYQEQNSLIPYNYNAYEYHNYSILPHIHGDLELIYVKNGVLEVIVGEDELTLGQGEAALIFPNQVHGFRTSRESLSWICVFSKDYVPEFGRLIEDRNCLDNRLHLDETDRQIICNCLMSAGDERLERCAGLMCACAAFMRGRSENDFKRIEDTGSETLIHQILIYISRHYEEDITLKGMAAELGYEEHYISRRFGAYFKMNFKQFVNEYRLQYARRLLADREQNLTMVEIAYRSGFQSVRNFNRAYKRLLGGQPRDEKR